MDPVADLDPAATPPHAVMRPRGSPPPAPRARRYVVLAPSTPPLAARRSAAREAPETPVARRLLAAFA